jgi:molybdate transport system substrate-binding protein
LGLALALASIGSAEAADLQVLAGGGMTEPLKVLAEQFRMASGHTIVLRFGTTPDLIKMATSGVPFDLAVVPREVFKDAAAQSKFAAGPTIDIARVGLGVAVRSGAPKPDVSTPEALKQALLKAKSVVSLPASAAGAQVMRVYDRLGIAEEMKAKTKAVAAPAEIVQAVTSGEAELGVFLTNVLTAPGVELVGPFPPELQQEIVWTAAVAADTTEANAARAFIAYLRSAAATQVIKAKGMTPG